MRIAYISFDQVPAPKGAATHIEAFVRGLAREFGQVDLVTVGGGGQRGEPWPGVRHWELPAVGGSLIDRVMHFRRLLGRWLEAREYDVIQFRSIFEGLPVVRGRKSAALIFEVNGLPSIELKYRYPGSEDDRELMRKLVAQERFCVGSADCIITPSAVTRRFLMASRGAREATVIPNGVDLGLFRQTLIHAGPLLYFGTLSPWQGVDLAIRAVARTDAFLKIIGAGKQEGLARLAEKLGCASRVEFLGGLPQAEVAAWLTLCRAVLAPLVWNDRNVEQGCCPLKVLEGMAAGRPVITSDLEVVRDLGVANGEHALLTKAGSVDGIIEAIDRLPFEAERLGANGRRLVEERFTWELMVEKLAAVYRRLRRDSRSAV